MAEKFTGEVTFDYGVSNLHRVVHADGMWGGPNGQGSLVVSFYSERPSVPVSASIQVENGTVVVPEKVLTGNVQRDIEVSVQMDLQIAISFLGWLQDRVSSMATNAGLPADELEKLVETSRANIVR
jgi:hypothetical protein